MQTSKPRSTASLIQAFIVLSTQGRLCFSLCRICWSDAEMDRSTLCTFKPKQLCKSSCRILDQTRSLVGRFSEAMALISSRSISPIAGIPISNSGTPMSANCVAIDNFSSNEKATPADCSPSLRVVSSIIIWRT